MPEQAFSLSSQSHTIYPNTETGSTYTKPYLNVIASRPCHDTTTNYNPSPCHPRLRMHVFHIRHNIASQHAGHISSNSGKLPAITLTFHKNFLFYDRFMTYWHLSSAQPPSAHFFTFSVDKSRNNLFLYKQIKHLRKKITFCANHRSP